MHAGQSLPNPHTNERYFKNRFHVKYFRITEKSLDLLLITETWLREKADELAIAEITPPG